MDITEVKVFPIQEEKLKAFVSVVFDHCFMVNDIKIIQGRDGLFISMPSRKKKNGEFKDVAHPLNNETRRMIEEKVLGEYERVLGERGEKMPRLAHLAPPSQSAQGEAAPPAPIPAPLAANGPAAAAAPLEAAAPGDQGAASFSTAAPAGGVSGPVASRAEKTLEEIEEMHLRDSFWTVT